MSTTDQTPHSTEILALAERAVASGGAIRIAPSESALSKVIDNSVTDRATMALALRDLSRLMDELGSGKSARGASDNDDLIRNGIVLVAMGLDSLSRTDDRHRAVLASLNGAGEESDQGGD